MVRKLAAASLALGVGLCRSVQVASVDDLGVQPASVDDLGVQSASVDDLGVQPAVVDDLGREECQCLPWAEVYSKYQVPCGIGLEMAHTMGNYVDDFSLMLRHGDARRKYAMSMKGDFQRSCTKFFHNMFGNACVNERKTVTGQDSLALGAWCYVSAQCSGDPAKVVELEGVTSVRAKQCTEGQDTFLRDLDIGDTAKQAAKSHVDHGMVVDHAYVRNATVAQDVTPEVLKEVADSGVPTVFWDYKMFFADRLLVKGPERWNLHIDKSGWTVTCLEGCTSCQEGCK